MEKILEKPWTYILQRNCSIYFLSVVCGTVGVYNMNIELTQEEESHFKARGATYIAELAAAISSKPQAYEDRHIELPEA